MAYYDVMGLGSQATTEEVKKAYRRLAIKVSFLVLSSNCSSLE
jgi:curved DNA-binding protein CbpA